MAMSLFLNEGIWCRVKIVTGDNAVLLEQLRLGDLDLVVGRLAAPEKMTGFSFEHLYSEQVVFAVRRDHPLLDLPTVPFKDLGNYPVLMPIKGSIIRPVVESYLLANGIHGFPTMWRPFRMLSDVHSCGPAMRSGSSRKVCGRGHRRGLLARLPLDTSETKGRLASPCAPMPYRHCRSRSSCRPCATPPGHRHAVTRPGAWLCRLNRAFPHNSPPEPLRRRGNG